MHFLWGSVERVLEIDESEIAYQGQDLFETGDLALTLLTQIVCSI